MTFSYELHARRDVLVNPKIYKVRTDVSWEEVQHNFMIQKKQLAGNTIFILLRHLLTYLLVNTHVNFTSHHDEIIGQWTAKKMRSYLEHFAKRKGLNPLVAETWYSLPHKELVKDKVLYPLPPRSFFISSSITLFFRYNICKYSVGGNYYENARAISMHYGSCSQRYPLITTSSCTVCKPQHIFPILSSYF